MSVPDIINDILIKHDLTIYLAEVLPSTTGEGGTRSALLMDNKGILHVIYKDDCILDINCLNQLTGRTLTCVPTEDINNICASKGLQRLPTIPHLLDLAVMIDQQVLDSDQVILDTGSEQRVLKLKKEKFIQLLGNASSADFVVNEKDLQTATLDNTHDLADITSAIANFTQLRIKQRLEETLSLPPLPETAQRIIKLRADPNADINMLCNIIESDPPLAAQIVSWAASPYYAAPGQIKSIHDAIMRVLGFDLVLSLALGLSLDKVLSLPQDKAQGITPYWKQAVYTASAVEALVSVIPPQQRPTIGIAYLSGLLHNLGYLILAEVFPPQFSTLCRYQEVNPHAHHSTLEKHLLGVTREQLGGWLLKSWNMPEEVYLAIRFQNEAAYQQENSQYANLLFIAQQLLRKHGIGNDASPPTIPDSIYEQLNMEPDQAEAAIESMMESLENLDLMASNLEGTT